MITESAMLHKVHNKKEETHMDFIDDMVRALIAMFIQIMLLILLGKICK